MYMQTESIIFAHGCSDIIKTDGLIPVYQYVLWNYNKNLMFLNCVRIRKCSQKPSVVYVRMQKV